MNTFCQKFIVLFIVAFGLMALPLQAQQVDQEETEQAFVQKGDFLTGFSLGLTNAHADSNSEFGSEFSRLLIDIDGLYFVSDHFGIGPLLGYRLNYQDSNIDLWNWNFKFGAKVGLYTSANELFSTSSLGRAQFFVDGGISWLRSREQMGEFPASEADYQFGYQVGTGLLFPVGEQIAIETKLAFQARRQDPLIGIGIPAIEWQKEVMLSVGFKVTL